MLDEILEREDIDFEDWLFAFNEMEDLDLDRSRFWELYWTGELDEILVGYETPSLTPKTET